MPADQADGLALDGERGMTAVLDPGRYHALDRVRALAMLMGVVYHALVFRMFTGGGFPSGPSKILGDWMHSFRMPLFFLIAGFFGRMMLVKYGTKEFLRRRFWRIGVPLFLGIFTFGPLFVVSLDVVMRPPSFGPGGPPPMGPPPGASETPGPGPGAFPPGGPPPGVEGGPPPGFGDGPPPAIEGGPPPGFGDGPPPGPPGGPPRRLAGGPGPGPGGGPPPGPPGGGGGPPPWMQPDGIFGVYTRYIQLNHLWFLWYLLVFITVTPFLAMGLSLVVPKAKDDEGDRLGLRMVRWGLAPLLLTVVATPALWLTGGMFGWYLPPAAGIFRAFPDFLFHYDLDMLFYFAYFVAGWWLHRERGALPGVARAWPVNLVVGFGAFAVAMYVEGKYAWPFGSGDPGWIKPAAGAVYCLGSACMCYAFLGVFLRYLDYPSRTWRYLADTALWVYLIHQPLVVLGLAAFRPLALPWWALTAAVSVSSVATALLLYEALVRRTPLARILGPASARRPTKPAVLDKQAEPALS